MASLNLVAKSNRRLFLKHPVINLIGLVACICVTALTLQLINGYQPMLDNKRRIVQQQLQQLTSLKSAQQAHRRHQQALSQRRTFIQRQQQNREALNAFAALLTRVHHHFNNAEIKLSKDQLNIAGGYRRITQTDSLKNWLHSHWVNSDIKTSVQKQLLPKQQVQLSLQRSPL